MIRFSLSLLFAFTGLASSSSGYDIGFITYAKYMHNKEFHPRKLPNLDLQNIKKREKKFLLIFTIFLLHFFCLYSPQKKHQIFLSRTCLQDLHIFKGELYGMSIIVSKKRLNDTRIFLYFSLEEFKH